MENLESKFKKAYLLASETDKKLPPDIMLKFYAYYKQATHGNDYKKGNGNEELRNAFKLNAWFQLSHLTEEDAKKNYIELVNKYLKIKK